MSVCARSPCCTTQTLSLHDNSLVGTIPDFSGALNLTYVDLHNNALTVRVCPCGGAVEAGTHSDATAMSTAPLHVVTALHAVRLSVLLLEQPAFFTTDVYFVPTSSIMSLLGA